MGSTDSSKPPGGVILFQNLSLKTDTFPDAVLIHYRIEIAVVFCFFVAALLERRPCRLSQVP